MKTSTAAIIAAFFAGIAVAVLGTKCPESWEPAVYWSMPLFHKIFPPWAAGPNPKAAGCALIVDAIILTGVVFWLLRSRGKRDAQKS
jgi:hypothetical protein